LNRYVTSKSHDIYRNWTPTSGDYSISSAQKNAKMHLMYTIDASGKRVYTLKKVVGSEVTKSAHPARFSPDDKYSRHRVTLKKRYGLLLTQQSTFFPSKHEGMDLALIMFAEDLKVLGQ